MAETSPGSLAVIGGRLEDSNVAVFAEMHRLSGGRILVFPTASSEPKAVGEESLQVFRTHGFDAEVAPLTPQNARRLANDPNLIARVGAYASVYFTGGDQANILASLAPKGVEYAAPRRHPRRPRRRRPRGRLQRRRRDDVAADDPRRHLHRVGRARRHHRPQEARPPARRRPRLLPPRHGRPALHQARPPRPAGGGHGPGRRPPRLRHRREHRAPHRGRQRAGLRRVRRHARSTWGPPRPIRTGRASATSASATSTTATASTSPASAPSRAWASAARASARWPTAPPPARGATSSAPTPSTT